ncbi:hypothetical protein M514_07142 [Trichuris suis]|uniref:Histone acetyltransferase n=1 Tax=Trichuris suis TaxID=68888 RepID=A0A085NPI0_9BILA|nr:hypothetical protein M514_07142 [Trichuris suis]
MRVDKNARVGGERQDAPVSRKLRKRNGIIPPVPPQLQHFTGRGRSASHVNEDASELQMFPVPLEELRKAGVAPLNRTELSPATACKLPLVHPKYSESEQCQCKIAGADVTEETCALFWGFLRDPALKSNYSFSEKACRERLLRTGYYFEEGGVRKWLPPSDTFSSGKKRGKEKQKPQKQECRSACKQQHPTCDALVSREDKSSSGIHSLNIIMSCCVFQTTLHSNFPQQFLAYENLFVCDNCFRRYVHLDELLVHEAECELRDSPPGTIVYKEDEIEIYQVANDDSATFCRNLCLFAKLLIECKTAVDGLHSFFFYVLIKRTTTGRKTWLPIGYFSKPRGDRYIDTLPSINLSCLLVMPLFMRKGYGRLLIDFSYYISRLRNLPGTPERPFSYSGVSAYRHYWSDVICQYLETEDGELSVKDMEKRTGVLAKDIVQTMEYLGMFRKKDNSTVLVESEEYITHCSRRTAAIKAGQYREVKEDCVIVNEAMRKVKLRPVGHAKSKRAAKSKSQGKSKGKAKQAKGKAKQAKGKANEAKGKAKTANISIKDAESHEPFPGTASQYVKDEYCIKTRSYGKAKENAQSKTRKGKKMVEQVYLSNPSDLYEEPHYTVQKGNYLKASANGPAPSYGKGKRSRITNANKPTEAYCTRRALGHAKSSCKVNISLDTEAYEKKALGKRKRAHNTDANESPVSCTKRRRLEGKAYVCEIGNANVNVRPCNGKKKEKVTKKESQKSKHKRVQVDCKRRRQRNGPAKSRNVEGPFGDVVGPDKLDLTFPPDIENDDDSSQRGILNEVDGRLDLHDSSIGRKEK